MLKTLTILGFILILLVGFVEGADADITGSYNDYGVNTDAIPGYNYLRISFNLQVNTAARYYFFAQIEDGASNIMQSTKTLDLSTGSKTITLDFEGTDIYRNRANGAFDVKEIFVYKVLTPSPPAYVDSVENPFQTSYYFYSDFQKPVGSPAITCEVSPCTASSILISSRDNIAAKSEPNSPNTIDGCKDGNKGIFAVDESIESISLSSAGGYFYQGGLVDATITAYCSMPNDRVSIAVANNSDDVLYKVVDYLYCGTNTGLRTFTDQFQLDDVDGYHAVRAIISRTGTIVDTCIDGEYTDHDDVVIHVYDGLCIDDDGDGYGTTPSELCNFIGIDCDDDRSNINPGETEICDGVDNNCDTTIDEGCVCVDGQIRSCGTNVGECDKGIQTCVGGHWGTCVGDVGPTPEICDMKDNNCNREIDEVCNYKVKILRPGWNLLSIPEIIDNDMPLSSYLFGDWKFYEEGNSNSNLDNITEENGFWMDSDEFTYQKYPRNALTEIIFDVKQGWNYIGYPSTEVKTVSDAFKGVDGFYTTIFSYVEGKWKSYNVDKTQNSLVNITDGKGYLVYFSKDMRVKFNGSYHKLQLIPLDFDLDLKTGWNLFTIPVDTNATIGDVFSSPVYSYDSKWIEVLPTEKFVPGRGYYVYSNTDRTVTINGVRLDSLTISLNRGANIIGLNNIDSLDVSVFTPISTAIEVVYVLEDGVWKSFTFNRFINSLSTIEPGQGIILISNTNTILNL